MYVLCHADDAVLTASSENNLQTYCTRLRCQNYDENISKYKKKVLIIIQNYTVQIRDER
jgi:hypothetical protein